MNKTQVKYIVGIYSAAMCIMGMLVPVPILSSIAKSFPDANIAAVQMCIGIIPLCMALSAMFVSSVLATRVQKRHTALACHVLIMVAGSGAGNSMIFQTVCGSSAPNAEDVKEPRPWMTKVIRGAALTEAGR